MTASLTDTRPIRLKGRSFLAIQLSPELPFGNWLARLDDLARRSTGFFLGRPIVLDVQGLDLDQAALKDLLGELGERGVRVMGIEGARPSILGFGMPPAMQGGRPAPDFEPSDAPAATAKTPTPKPDATKAAEPTPAVIRTEVAKLVASLVIDQPVRSGQSIIFPEGDVTVLGAVSSGAEIVAGGSIHVYGALRGRAMAGSVGDANARIFCGKLEAELVAIDGLYKMADDFDRTLIGSHVHIWLDGETMRTDRL